MHNFSPADTCLARVCKGLRYAAIVGLCFFGSGHLTAAPPSATIAGFKTWVIGLAYAPDGKTLASVGGESLLYRPGAVKLWDTASGKELQNLAGHETSVWGVAISPDGKLLATSGYDGTVKTWDLPAGKPRASWEAHKNWVLSVAFSPDGKTLATASEDTTIKLWDLSSAQPTEKKVLKGHSDTVTCAAWSADGKTLASSSNDKTADPLGSRKGGAAGQVQRSYRRCLVALLLCQGRPDWPRPAPIAT